MWLFSRDPVRDFPFELGPPEPDPDPAEPAPAEPAPAPLWRQLRGRRKADGAPVSVFVHSLGTGDPRATALARAALKRLRSLRHPNVLAFLDSLEPRRVTPLRRHLRLRPPTGDTGQQEVAWGLHQLLTALQFLIGCGLAHGALGVDAVFVAPGGDWKLGGLERVAPAGEGGAPPAPPARAPPPPSSATPRAGGTGEPWAGDMWRLGCLIWEIFNGPLPRPRRAEGPPAGQGPPTPPEPPTPPRDPPTPPGPQIPPNPPREPPTPPGTPGRSGTPPTPPGTPDTPQPPPQDPREVPGGLVAAMCELVAAEPSLRPGPEQLLQRLQRPGAFLSCALVRTALFLTHMQLRDPGERREFLQTLPQLLDSLPGAFLRHKLLPRLLEALEMGSADASALRPLLKVTVTPGHHRSPWGHWGSLGSWGPWRWAAPTPAPSDPCSRSRSPPGNRIGLKYREMSPK
ncbi:LOW QUALITY PROTEIN: N-terminal kinase-like protein [Columba livia]|uniref:LOW QUALITY PROTEIN: N-terminal kinase-like protein n=1 Tax=Columba livia TaxID=8932 RepID=UPI0031BAE5F4